MKAPHRALLLPAALLMTGCLSSQPIDPAAPAGAPLGTFAVSTAALGRREVTARECASGEHQQFLGFDLGDASTGTAVRLVVDPLEGAAVRVYDPAKPFDLTRAFRRSECAVFHFSIDSTGIRVNHWEDYRVSIEVDCTGKDGDFLKGRASATHCF